VRPGGLRIDMERKSEAFAPESDKHSLAIVKWM
jgi:hypothetical protein